jgi:hypothetical protein
MEADQKNFGQSNLSSKPISASDPLVIGAGAFFIGFVIGAGRWNWLGREAGRVASSIGSLAMTYLTQSFEETHPNLFAERSRTTH